MKAILTVDLGFGDAGKGSIVDALVRQLGASLVVRYCGGSQCGHNVYDVDGRHHCFSQIGSGTFVSKTYTFLSRYMLVNPLTLIQEAERLVEKGVSDALNRVFIDKRCLIITPYHRALNRLRELSRGGSRHGSCGAGVGECAAYALQHPEDALRIGDFDYTAQFAGKFMICRDRMQKEANALSNLPDTPEVTKQLSTFTYDLDRLFDKYVGFYHLCGARCVDDYGATRMLSSQKLVVFEGAQGVLLDETYGFHPFTTWSTTTTRNAKLLLEEAEISEPPVVIGVLRSYMTRHGAGPLPTEDQQMTRTLGDANNPRNPWQGGLRCGALDIPLLEYAMRHNGKPDYLAVTHLDQVTAPWPVCVRYEYPQLGHTHFTLDGQERLAKLLGQARVQRETIDAAENFLPWLEQTLGVPVGIASYGPGPGDKKFRGLLVKV